jgi:hypothetical protein
VTVTRGDGLVNVSTRRVTFFEKVLLFIGVTLALLGFYLINSIYQAGGRLISFEMLGVVFAWIILLFLVVIAAITENQREESRLIDAELHTETRLMRELIKDQVIEIKLLREDIKELRKIEHDLHPAEKKRKVKKR